jgi:hypothetical protein
MFKPEMPEWLKSALNDGSNPAVVSMTRLNTLLVLISTIVLPMVLWFELSCLVGKMVEIPGSVIGFIGAANGIAAALFAANKRAEG